MRTPAMDQLEGGVWVGRGYLSTLPRPREQTNICENITFLQLRWRAVIINHECWNFYFCRIWGTSVMCDGNSLVLFHTGKAGDDEGSYDPRDGAAKVRLQNHFKHESTS